MWRQYIAPAELQKARQKRPRKGRVAIAVDSETGAKRSAGLWERAARCRAPPGVRVELRSRQPDGAWSSTLHGVGETVNLPSISCELNVDEIYRDAAPAD